MHCRLLSCSLHIYHFLNGFVYFVLYSGFFVFSVLRQGDSMQWMGLLHNLFVLLVIGWKYGSLNICDWQLRLTDVEQVSVPKYVSLTVKQIILLQYCFQFAMYSGKQWPKNSSSHQSVYGTWSTELYLGTFYEIDWL